MEWRSACRIGNHPCAMTLTFTFGTDRQTNFVQSITEVDTNE